MRFRKKPVVIDAIEFTGDNAIDVLNFVEMATIQDFEKTHTLVIQTLEGDMLARVGDWIIRGVAGEYYPCKSEIFAATYEPVE